MFAVARAVPRLACAMPPWSRVIELPARTRATELPRASAVDRRVHGRSDCLPRDGYRARERLSASAKSQYLPFLAGGPGAI